MSMDPERLALIREMVSEGVLDDHVATLAEVLADRDDLAREVERVKTDATAKIFELGEPANFARAEAAESEVERLRGELDVRLRDLAIAYGRHECGQRQPSPDMLRDHARRVAARERWPDPYPSENGAPEVEPIDATEALRAGVLAGLDLHPTPIDDADIIESVAKLRAEADSADRIGTGYLARAELAEAEVERLTAGYTVERGSWTSMSDDLLAQVIASAKSIRAAAKEIGVPRSTLGNWVRRSSERWHR